MVKTMQLHLSDWKYFWSILENTAWMTLFQLINNLSILPTEHLHLAFLHKHNDISEKLELVKEIKNSATFSRVDLWASCVKGWLALPTFCVHFPFYICNPWAFSIFYLQHSKIEEKKKKLLREAVKNYLAEFSPTPLSENHFGKNP